MLILKPPLLIHAARLPPKISSPRALIVPVSLTENGMVTPLMWYGVVT